MDQVTALTSPTPRFKSLDLIRQIQVYNNLQLIYLVQVRWQEIFINLWWLYTIKPEKLKAAHFLLLLLLCQQNLKFYLSQYQVSQAHTLLEFKSNFFHQLLILVGVQLFNMIYKLMMDKGVLLNQFIHWIQ